MQITTAIQNKHLLSFFYDGYQRIVEPHTYGIDTKGHKALRAYQVSGGSESGQRTGWKLFHVNDIRSLSVLTEQFSCPRPKYKRGDTAFSTIYAEL